MEVVNSAIDKGKSGGLCVEKSDHGPRGSAGGVAESVAGRSTGERSARCGAAGAGGTDG